MPKATPPRLTAQTAPRTDGRAARSQSWGRAAVRAASRAPHVLFPQWLRTAFAVFLWLGLVPLQVSVTALYVDYTKAMVMCACMGAFAGLAPTLFPSRTPPWRTVAWAWFLSVSVGMATLSLGGGHLSLTLTALTGFGVIFLRTGQWGRRLVGLVQTWRAVR